MKKAFVLVVFLALLTGCNGLNFTDPAKEAEKNAIVLETQNGLVQLQSDLHAQAAASTQPGSTVPAPSPKVVEIVDKLVEKGKIIAPALTAPPQPDGNPGPFITAIAPATGSFALWVSLAGTLVTAAWGLWKTIGKKKADDASASTLNALSSAIARKEITVTPAAVKTVDDIVTDHPVTDKVVDMLSDASGTPRIA